MVPILLLPLHVMNKPVGKALLSIAFGLSIVSTQKKTRERHSPSQQNQHSDLYTHIHTYIHTERYCERYWRRIESDI
jgi:PleD family two-component response regulator